MARGATPSPTPPPSATTGRAWCRRRTTTTSCAATWSWRFCPTVAASTSPSCPTFRSAADFLTGKYRPGEAPPPGSRGAEGSGIIAKTRNERNEAILAQLEAFCAERNRSVLELAFGWLLAQQAIPSVIAGTSSPAQIEANVNAAAWTLTDDEVAEVKPHRRLGRLRRGGGRLGGRRRRARRPRR